MRNKNRAELVFKKSSPRRGFFFAQSLTALAVQST